VSRSILSVAISRPAWQVGPFRVEGPDEDPFTMGVEVLRRLGGSVRTAGASELHRVHLVGPFPPEADWGFAEALGLPGLEIRRHPTGPSGLWGALAAAAHDAGGPGREAVVVADSAGPRENAAWGASLKWGAAAAAFLLGGERGLAVLRHGFRGHAPGRGPSMRAQILAWLDALSLPPTGGRGEILLAGDEEAGRWLPVWEEVAPGVSVASAGSDPPGLGPAPSVRPAFLLWDLFGRLRTGETGMIVEVGRGRSGFAGFRLEGAVRWVGDWTEPGTGIRPAGDRFLERAATASAVSQGAYVPHPRYLENLPSRWRLVADRCPACEGTTFPQRGFCRHCGASENLAAQLLPSESLEVEAVTTIGSGAQPTEFDPQVAATGPYDVALVSLAPGLRATLQVADAPPGQLQVGDRVDTILRRLYPMEGEWRYGLKAVPRAGIAESSAEPPAGSSRAVATTRPSPSRSRSPSSRSAATSRRASSRRSASRGRRRRRAA
jgi:uncharacterized OB-fold protein